MVMQVPRTNRTTMSAQPLIGPSGRGATPDAFGAQVAQSTARAGGALVQLGGMLQQQQDQKSRFDALVKFSAFNNEITKKIAESKRNADPAMANFSEVVTAEFQNAAATFLEEQIPPDLREEFSSRLAQMGESVFNDSLAFQYEATDAYFKRGISDAYEKARVDLGQNPTIDNLDLTRARIDEIIDSTDISEAEKVALRRTAYTGIESVVYKAEQVKRIMDEAVEGTNGSAQRQAIDLLSLKSGGTDEELAALAQAGEQLAVQSLGSLDTWAALPSRARASLIALAAERGGLPGEVIAAVQSGDLEEVAGAVRSLGEEEAANLVLDPGATLDDDARFANIPYEDRLAVIEDAKRQAASMITEQEKARKAQNAMQVNGLMTAIYDGRAGQVDIDNARESGILTDIDDIVKAQKLLDDKTEALRLTQMMSSMITNEQTMDPNDADQKKMFNAYIGEQGLKALANKDEAYASTVLLPAVRSVQDIPTDVVGALTGMIRSNDWNKAKWAMDLMSQLQQASPDAYAMRFDDKAERDAAFYLARKDYYPEEALIPMVRGGITQAERAATEQLRIAGNDVYTRQKVADGLLGALVPWGIGHNDVQYSVPWAAKALESEFQALFIDEYSRDGDVQRAKDAAIGSLKKVWGITTIGGKPNLMKYPPEQVGYKPIGGSFDWINEQVRADTGLADDESFEILSDEQTREEFESSRARRVSTIGSMQPVIPGGASPSYVMIRVDANGVGRIMLDDGGLPVRVAFEVTPEMRAAQEAEFQRKRGLVELSDISRIIDQSQQHSLDTAIPVPEDVNASANMSLQDYMMSDDPVLQEEAVAGMNKLLFGDPNAQTGIATGQYRLP